MSPAAKRMALQQVRRARAMASLGERQAARRFHRRMAELQQQFRRDVAAMPPPPKPSFWAQVWEIIKILGAGPRVTF